MSLDQSVEYSGGMLPAPTLAQRAAANDLSAASELVRRLSAGDVTLAHAVGAASDPAARSVRDALVRFLARGQWHGRALPLPSGFHAGRASQHLRDLLIQAACAEHVPAWRATLLDALPDADAVVRQTAASLLSQCRGPDVVAALVAVLSDREESVRWAAALALAHMDRAGVAVVLKRLASQDVRPEMRHVAAHVLRHAHDAALREQLAPVVQALDGSNYRVEAPLAAEDALQRLGGMSPVQ